MMASSDDRISRGFATTPLPNPGEGGPVAGGGGTPAIPLPNPGEGGPIIPENNIPVIPLPNPGEGGSVGGSGSNLPMIPLPNPGEGGPVYPGRPGQTIPILPLPNPPCFFCNTDSRFGKVRFLNAAFGYQPFRVFINRRFIVNGLGFASLTPYGRISDGFQTVTVTGTNGYVYIQKSMPFRAGDTVTIAIINTASGLDLMQISDEPCTRPRNMSCFRACNLAYYSNPIDVILEDGRVVYSDVRYKEVTTFKRIRPGEYMFYLAETNLRPMPRYQDIETVGSGVTDFDLPEALVSVYVDVKPNNMYTLFILSRGITPGAIQTMVVEDS